MPATARLSSLHRALFAHSGVLGMGVLDGDYEDLMCLAYLIE